jgi:hypothetical protein
MIIRKKSIYALFIVILLSTEFLHIELFGGVLRPYHFLAPLVIFSLFNFINNIARTGVLWALVGFFLINIMAAALANSPPDAFRSLGLLAINMSITVAVALILVSGRLELESVIQIALAVAVVGIVMGVVQVTVFHFAGIDLTFTLGQAAQVGAGFSTGLRSEANTFAKNLNTVFLLMLPTLLADRNWRRALLIFSILILGMLTSLTRSALYGLSVTLVITYVWYLLSGRGRPVAKRPLVAVVLVAVAFAIFASVVVYFNPYAAHKLALFFDSDEILEGGSSGFRLMSQGILWDAFLDTDKTFWFGNGWGQVRFPYGDIDMQAGGAEIITALSYGGVFSGLFYCIYQLTAIISVRRSITINRDNTFSRLSEGVMLALIGLLVTGQINGAMIAPEYWMVFGMAIAIRSISKERSRLAKIATADRGWR